MQVHPKWLSWIPSLTRIPSIQYQVKISDSQLFWNNIDFKFTTYYYRVNPNSPGHWLTIIEIPIFNKRRENLPFHLTRLLSG